MRRSTRAPRHRKPKTQSEKPSAKRENELARQKGGKWRPFSRTSARDVEQGRDSRKSRSLANQGLAEAQMLELLARCANWHERLCENTFYPDISVKSFCFHDTKRIVQDHVVEGEHRWVLQGLLSRASFCHVAESRLKVFTVLSLRTSNNLCQCQKNRRKNSCFYDL